MSPDVGSCARYLILDVGYPMTREQLRRCVQAFENVVALGSIVQNNSRTSSLGMQLINSSLQNICRLKSVDKCFPIISVALKNILRIITVNERISTSDFMDLLNLAIREALRDFQEMTASSLHLTLLTRRDGPLVQETLEAAFKSQIYEAVSTFQVLALADDGELARPVSSGAVGGRIRLKRVPVRSIGSLEDALKGVWFERREAELKRLCLVLPASVQEPLREFELLCAASECLLDPSGLPVADRFLLWPPPPAESFLAPAGRTEVRLRVLTRLSADGLCEASMFGPPVRVASAPPGFLEPADFQRDHAQMFREMCCQLQDSDEYLIVRMQQHDGDHLGGHFVLMAGDEDCLLLRAIASAELLLPAAPEDPGDLDPPPAPELRAAVRGILDQLPITQHFRARDFPSGLYRALVGHASFPARRGASAATAATPRTRGPSSKRQPAASVSSKGLNQLTLPAAFGKENVMAGLSSAGLPERKAVNSGDPWSKPHKLGTGGHPALTDDPAPARKRRGPRGRGWNPPGARQGPERMDSSIVIEDDEEL